MVCVPDLLTQFSRVTLQFNNNNFKENTMSAVAATEFEVLYRSLDREGNSVRYAMPIRGTKDACHQFILGMFSEIGLKNGVEFTFVLGEMNLSIRDYGEKIGRAQSIEIYSVIPAGTVDPVGIE